MTPTHCIVFMPSHSFVGSIYACHISSNSCVGRSLSIKFGPIVKLVSYNPVSFQSMGAWAAIFFSTTLARNVCDKSGSEEAAPLPLTKADYEEPELTCNRGID